MTIDPQNPTQGGAVPTETKDTEESKDTNPAVNGGNGQPPIQPTKGAEVGIYDAFNLGWALVELKGRVKTACYRGICLGMRDASVWRATLNLIATLQANTFAVNSTAQTLYEPPDQAALPYLYPPAEDFTDLKCSNYPNKGIPNTDSSGKEILGDFKLYDVTRRAINCLTLLYVDIETSLIPKVIKLDQDYLIEKIREAAEKPEEGGGHPAPSEFEDKDADPAKPKSDIQQARETLTERISRFLDAWDGYLRENFYIGCGSENDTTLLVAYEAGNSMGSISWSLGTKLARIEWESKKGKSDSPESDSSKQHTDSAEANGDSSKQNDDLTKASNDSSKTSSDPTEVNSDPTQAGSDPTKTSSNPTQAGSDPTKISSDPKQAGSDRTKISSDPKQAGSDPTKISSDPKQAGSDPTQAGSVPTNKEINSAETNNNTAKENVQQPASDETATIESNREVLRVWKDVFEEKNVIRLQHQISALSSVLDDAFYARTDAKRPEDGAVLVAANPDLPSQSIAAVKRSLDYWEKTITWMGGKSGETGQEVESLTRLKKESMHGRRWSRSMQLKLNEQANIWQLLMTGGQSLRAYNMESAALNVFGDVREDIKKRLQSGLNLNLTQVEENLRSVEERVQKAIKDAEEAAKNGLMSLFSTSTRWIYWMIGVSAVVVALVLVTMYLGISKGEVSATTLGTGFSGLASAVLGFFGIRKLNSANQNQADAVTSKHQIASSEVSNQSTNVQKVAKENVLTRLENTAGQAGSIVWNALMQGYQQARIELDGLRRSVAVAYPLIEFLGANFDFDKIVSFLTEVIWSVDERNEEIERVTQAAFGPLAVFIPTIASSEKSTSEQGGLVTSGEQKG